MTGLLLHGVPRPPLRSGFRLGLSPHSSVQYHWSLARDQRAGEAGAFLELGVVDADLDAHLVKHEDKPLGGDIGPRAKGAAAQASDGRIEAIDSCLQRGKRVGQRHVARIVKVDAHRQVRPKIPGAREEAIDLSRIGSADRVGRRPHAMSNNTTPREKISVLGPSSHPSARSGLMCATVPITTPGSVVALLDGSLSSAGTSRTPSSALAPSGTSPAGAASWSRPILASPKSSTFTWPRGVIIQIDPSTSPISSKQPATSPIPMALC